MSLRDSSNRYSPGGDLYNDIATRFGTEWANRAYSATLVDDGGLTLRNVLNDAHQAERNREFARPGSTSTTKNFFDQITTDPLAAPLDGLNSQLGKAVWNVVKNPFVLLLLVGLGYLFLKRKRFL